MNYLQRKKLAFMSIVNQIKGFVRTVVGIPPLVLPDCVGGTNLINYSISGDSVQDGTPTPDNPVEIESVGEYDEATGKYKIPITVRGKNLLKISGRSLGTLTGTAATTVRNLEFDKYYVGLTRNNIYAPSYVLSCSITGDVVTVEAKLAYNGVAFPIKAKPNTTYRISALNDSVIGIGFYTKDGEFIKDGLTYKIITTPENCEIMTIVCAPAVTNTATIYEELQVEEGEIATDYEPYQEPTETSIYLDEPLRKVGDVADYIDFENGKVVRNIGVQKVNFSFYSFNANNNYLYLRGSVRDMLKDSLSCMSNKIKSFTTFPGSSHYNKLMVSGRYFFYLVEAEENQQQYYIDLMAGTEIHYLLETPTEEIISLPAIPSFKGTTILSPDTTIKPSNMSAIYYSTSKE